MRRQLQLTLGLDLQAAIWSPQNWHSPSSTTIHCLFLIIFSSMFEVGFNPIYPAEHRIEYCSSVRTASPDKPVSAPMEPHTLLSPLRLYIWMEILTLCISALDSLLQIELLRATTSVRDGPGYIILQIS